VFLQHEYWGGYRDILGQNWLLAASYKRKNTMEGWKIEVDGWQTWVWDFVLMSVLVIQ
jgi:hypothetical protein